MFPKFKNGSKDAVRLWGHSYNKIKKNNILRIIGNKEFPRLWRT